MNSHRSLRVLFLSLEFPRWSSARAWGYAANLGIEEGFKKNNIEFLTINTQYLPCARQICAGKRFDQVWVETVHNNSDDTFWEWLTGLAPVRIGMAFESLQYTPQEIEDNPSLRGRRTQVEARFRYLTHVVAVDEIDVAAINKSGHRHALWWPGTVPERFIINQGISKSEKYAVFSGTAYGIRASWLKHPSLQDILVQHTLPNRRTLYHGLFDILQFVACKSVYLKLPGVNLFTPLYNNIMRYIRQHDFAGYLHSLRTYSAVVNLPSYVKAFPGRVVEGMAAGRPVISNEIVGRPRNNHLFNDGQEILLYLADEPEQLAEQIRRILDDPILANRIATNALRKLKLFHTTEKRVSQVMQWIESGKETYYE